MGKAFVPMMCMLLLLLSSDKQLWAMSTIKEKNGAGILSLLIGSQKQSDKFREIFQPKAFRGKH